MKTQSSLRRGSWKVWIYPICQQELASRLCYLQIYSFLGRNYVFIFWMSSIFHAYFHLSDYPHYSYRRVLCTESFIYLRNCLACSFGKIITHKHLTQILTLGTTTPVAMWVREICLNWTHCIKDYLGFFFLCSGRIIVSKWVNILQHPTMYQSETLYFLSCMWYCL